MRVYFDHDFIKKYKEYMELYKRNRLPVIICDSELNAGWGNPAAETLYPNLTDKKGFDLLLLQFNKEEILKSLKTEGSVWFHNVIGFSDIMLGLTAIIKDGGIFGVVAELINPDAIILEPQARQVSQTPVQIQSSIRKSVAEIFNAMDNATQMEHLLLEKSELRGIGLDTGFISESFNIISRQGYYLLRMATNITAYSELSSAPPHVKLASVDMFELISKTKDVIKALAADMDIPVEFSLPDENGIVGLDSEKFELAFFNILNNAFYFTKENNCVTITGAADKKKVSVTVGDHGAGIPKDVLPHIFDPYFAKGHGSKSPGIGLGLTVAKAMIEAQNGTIKVKSVKNKGTEVTITLPRGIFARRPTSLMSGSRNLAAEKFSHLYVGLVDAARSPYNPKN